MGSFRLFAAGAEILERRGRECTAEHARHAELHLPQRRRTDATKSQHRLPRSTPPREVALALGTLELELVYGRQSVLADLPRLERLSRLDHLMQRLPHLDWLRVHL